MMRALVLFLSLISVAWAQIPGGERLDYFLDLDRFQFYTQEWARTMKGRGKVEMADAVLKWTAPELAALKPDPKKLKDAFNYDDLILQFLKKKNPSIKATKEDVAWGYDFYKRKLNEAYLVKGSKPAEVAAGQVVSSPGPSTPYPLKPLESEEVLLNVDSYASDRTTRAVFWEASEAGRRIELHVGTAADFKNEMSRRGARVLGEVYPKARNYNPIYLVQDPGEKTFHYAITEIAGEDRVRHLAMQSALVRWENSTGKLTPPPVTVVGESVAKLAAEEAELTQVLKVLPKADHVVIGQKGAFERTFGSMGKATAILDVAKKNPAALKAALSEDQMKLVNKAMADSDGLVVNVMKNASGWDKVYEAAQADAKVAKLLPPQNFVSYNLDRASYQVSDYIMIGADGKEQRWRIFSNSWGDEVLPVARALKATGQTDVVYIGTAGALPQSELKVGDLITPKKTQDINGVIRAVNGDVLAPSAKTVDLVTNVSSPYQETGAWLKSQTGVAQAVEVETGYLSSVFNGKNDRLSIMLLVSDVVGSEGETLAEASSSIRRNAQIAAISTVLKEAGVVTPGQVAASSGIYALLDEMLDGKDLAYRYQIQQLAIQERLHLEKNPRKALEALIAKTPSFTTSRLTGTLAQSGERFERLLKLIDQEGLSPRLSLGRDFLEGRWGPSKPIEIHFQARSKKSLDELNQIIAIIQKDDKNFAKLLRITTGSEVPEKTFVQLARMPEGPEVFTQLYKDSALGFGGLATTETTSGATKFVKVAQGQMGSVQGDLAFFEPNAATMEMLQELQGEGKGAKVLKTEVDLMNEAAGANKPWKIVTTVVDDLPGGRLAQILPEIDGAADNLTISLKITKQGIKNPAVVMEELIHLQQITGVDVPWQKGTKLKAFVHPYHWAEVVANAQAGSPQAAEKIARLELEASQISEDAVNYYRRKGLFTSDKEVIDKYLAQRAAHAEDIYNQVADVAALDRKKKLASWERAKKVFGRLEAQKVKLNDLVAKGDRAGVRKMVESYLPWDLMEPSEQKVWTDWLDAMEKPNKKNVELVFRGMYDDTVMMTREGKPYLMSTVLSRNQGNYTRRLRSLTTMREKFGSHALRDWQSAYSSAKNPGSVSVLMANHAIEAKGSPFISTASYDVATKFGPRQIGAFNLAPDRFALNALAPDIYMYQKERLTPLIIFPDEVVYFHDYAANPVAGVGPRDPVNRRKHFIGEVEKVLGREVTTAELSGVGTDRQFLERSFDRLKPMILEPKELPQVKGCVIGGANGCDCILKTLNALLK